MASIDHLLEIMARLRDPLQGCPWDREQTFATIAPYTIEEAYEVADAVERKAYDQLKDELGDLLLQVVFHARIAEEEQRFTFDDVVEAIVDKMQRRHPHVFGDAKVESAEEQTHAWEAHKAGERAKEGGTGVLAGVALGLPALLRAQKLVKRAARVGFEWPDVSGVLDKLEEELEEMRAEFVSGDREALAGEIGDVLFVCANLARYAGVDAEAALRTTNAKFERRFGYIEEALAAQGRDIHDSSLEEMDGLWDEAKKLGI
jgi:MazG family protein